MLSLLYRHTEYHIIKCPIQQVTNNSQTSIEGHLYKVSRIYFVSLQFSIVSTSSIQSVSGDMHKPWITDLQCYFCYGILSSCGMIRHVLD